MRHHKTMASCMEYLDSIIGERAERRYVGWLGNVVFGI